MKPTEYLNKKFLGHPPKTHTTNEVLMLLNDYENNIVWDYFYNEEGDFTITSDDEPRFFVKGESTAKRLVKSLNQKYDDHNKA